MSAAPEMRSPAPLAGGKDRAEGNRNGFPFTIAKPEREENFAALFLARRYGLARPVARTIAVLANVGRTFA